MLLVFVTWFIDFDQPIAYQVCLATDWPNGQSLGQAHVICLQAFTAFLGDWPSWPTIFAVQ